MTTIVLSTCLNKEENKMDITYLKSFYTTAKCNSISKAAKVLHLTQPGLSMQLQALEGDLNTTLLERSNKGVSLTPEGQIVFNYAKAILNLESNMYKELEQLASQKQQLMIGACTSLADYALPCSAYTFKQIHEMIDIHIESSTCVDILQKLRSQEINLGIINTHISSSDMVQIPLLKSPVSLVKNANSPHTSLTLEDLPSLPLIMREETSFINHVIFSSLEQYHIHVDDLNILFYFNSDEAIKRALLCQDAYAFLPEIVIKHELQNQTLKKVYLGGFELECTYTLLYRKGYELKEHEKLFVDFITSSRRCFCY